jgi:FAD/FMN-containing dehydrogenase
VEPASAEDVSLILKTVTAEGCHFAVKSGGHAREAGFSNADAGVTIDLVRMGSVELSKDKKSVKVGAGARWLDAYSTLEKDNLTVVGGRVSDVGVGGLTLGGS